MVDERLAVLEEKVDVILNNHLAHIQASQARMETNMEWLMKFFWLIAAASVGSIVTTVMNLILNK